MALYGNGSCRSQRNLYNRRNPSRKNTKHHQKEEGIMAQMMYYMSEARLRNKIRKINEALEEDPVDVQALRNLAISQDGLITNDLRRRVWPKMLNVNVYDIPKYSQNKKDNVEINQFKSNKYWNQVNLDVDRSHRRFPHEMRATRRKVLQAQLTNIIMRVLCKHTNLHYYQGYHDIAVTLLLVVGEDLATALLENISLHYLRDFMAVTMESTTKMLAFMHPIINKADPELEEFLLRSEVGQMFALSWLITWYGHVLKDFDVIVRLYDFFIATHPLMPVYFAAALVIDHRDEILLGECEMSCTHHMLSKIPERFPYNVEELIISAKFLFDKYSPKKLASAAEKYLKESTAVSRHSQFIKDLGDQQPDSVLRERRIQGHSKRLQFYENPDTNRQSTNPYTKLAVWALTASLGTVALYVLSSAKRWI